MNITAKHSGECTACGCRLLAGAEVEWDLFFGPRCLACSAARRYPERRNRIGEHCYRCDLFCAPGSGLLEPDGATAFKVRCIARTHCDRRATQRGAA